MSFPNDETAEELLERIERTLQESLNLDSTGETTVTARARSIPDIGNTYGYVGQQPVRPQSEPSRQLLEARRSHSARQQLALEMIRQQYAGHYSDSTSERLAESRRLLPAFQSNDGRDEHFQRVVQENSYIQRQERFVQESPYLQRPPIGQIEERCTRSAQESRYMQHPPIGLCQMEEGSTERLQRSSQSLYMQRPPIGHCQMEEGSTEGFLRSTQENSYMQRQITGYCQVEDGSTESFQRSTQERSYVQRPPIGHCQIEKGSTERFQTGVQKIPYTQGQMEERIELRCKMAKDDEYSSFPQLSGHSRGRGKKISQEESASSSRGKMVKYDGDSYSRSLLHNVGRGKKITREESSSSSRGKMVEYDEDSSLWLSGHSRGRGKKISQEESSSSSDLFGSTHGRGQQTFSQEDLRAIWNDSGHGSHPISGPPISPQDIWKPRSPTRQSSAFVTPQTGPPKRCSGVEQQEAGSSSMPKMLEASTGWNAESNVSADRRYVDVNAQSMNHRNRTMLPVGSSRPGARRCSSIEDGGYKPKGASYSSFKNEPAKQRDEMQGNVQKQKPTYSDVVTKWPAAPKKQSTTQKNGRQNQCRSKSIDSAAAIQSFECSSVKMKNSVGGLEEIELPIDNTCRQQTSKRGSKSSTRSNTAATQPPKTKIGRVPSSGVEEIVAPVRKEEILDTAPVSTKGRKEHKETTQKRSSHNNKNNKSKLNGNSFNGLKDTETGKNKFKKDSHKKSFEEAPSNHKKDRANGSTKAMTKKQSGKKKKESNVASSKKETLVKKLALQCWYFVGIIAAWLFHLVSDVSSMSIRLLGQMCLYVGNFVFLYMSYLFTWCQTYWRSMNKKKSASGISEGHSDSALPTTGEDAIKRLLSCRNQDPYSILGLRSNCTNDEIRKYYRRQAVLVHPDKNTQPGSEEAFKILVRAFQVIGDPVKRADYDSNAKKKTEDWSSEFSELFDQLQKKRDEASNTIKCTNCNRRHRRIKTKRPLFSARFCNECNLSHPAREGDLWSESKCFGYFPKYYACMDGDVYDVTEWAGCQRSSLAHLESNTHKVAYRIVSSTPDQPRSHIRRNDLNDFLCGLYRSGHQPPQLKKRGKQRR